MRKKEYVVQSDAIMEARSDGLEPAQVADGTSDTCKPSQDISSTLLSDIGPVVGIAGGLSGSRRGMEKLGRARSRYSGLPDG
jgi:hypothetical protein